MALELLRLVRQNIYTQDASLVQGYAHDMNDVVSGLIEEYIGEEKGQRKNWPAIFLRHDAFPDQLLYSVEQWVKVRFFC